MFPLSITKNSKCPGPVLAVICGPVGLCGVNQSGEKRLPIRAVMSHRPFYVSFCARLCASKVLWNRGHRGGSLWPRESGTVRKFLGVRT